MTTKRWTWTIIGIVLIAGCLTPGATTPTPPSGQLQAGSVKFLGEMGDNTTHFVMRGKLMGCWDYRMGPSNCSDVTVELYERDGTRLRTFRVGYLNGSKNISLVASVVPYYVLIRSPDFWGHSFVSIYYYERGQDGRYWARANGERDEFPAVIDETSSG